MFRHLLHNLFRAKARDTVHREVERAVADRLARNKETVADEANKPPCDVGVIFALEIEAGGLIDLLAERVTLRGSDFVARIGTLGGRRVAVVVSGAGLERARRATEAMIDGHRPRWIISAGFAGGLNPKAARHDIVMADSLIDEAGERLSLDLTVDRATLSAGVHVGPLLTMEKIVRLPDEKRMLGERRGALAVDTESAAVAAICRERRVPMLAVRIITDSVDETLPTDVQHLTDQTSAAARLGAAMATVWRRPSSVKDLWALKETALTGSDRLARFLTGVVASLKPSMGGTQE